MLISQIYLLSFKYIVYLQKCLNFFLEVIKVYDGNASLKRRMFRTITVSRNATREQMIVCIAL